jgi:hypothetical protein
MEFSVIRQYYRVFAERRYSGNVFQDSIIQCRTNNKITCLCYIFLASHTSIAIHFYYKYLTNSQLCGRSGRWVVKARHRTLSWATKIKSSPRLFSSRSILKSSFHLILRFVSLSIPPVFPTNILHTYLHTWLDALAVHHLRLIIVVIFDEECTLWSSSLCNFLHPTVFSSFFIPFSTFKLRNRLLHPYKTGGKIIKIYLWRFTVVGAKFSAVPRPVISVLSRHCVSQVAGGCPCSRL